MSKVGPSPSLSVSEHGSRDAVVHGDRASPVAEAEPASPERPLKQAKSMRFVEPY